MNSGNWETYDFLEFAWLHLYMWVDLCLSDEYMSFLVCILFNLVYESLQLDFWLTCGSCFTWIPDDYKTSSNGSAGNFTVHQKASHIKVPKIYWRLTRKAVLTMEWIDGIKLTDKDRLRKACLNRKELIHRVLSALSFEKLGKQFISASSVSLTWNLFWQLHVFIMLVLACYVMFVFQLCFSLFLFLLS